jgi:hypothetical protein
MPTANLWRNVNGSSLSRPGGFCEEHSLQGKLAIGVLLQRRLELLNRINGRNHAGVRRRLREIVQLRSHVALTYPSRPLRSHSVIKLA